MDAQSNQIPGHPPQGHPPPGYLPPGYLPPGYLPSGYLLPGYQAPGNPPQGYQAQENPPQAYPSQGNQAQGYAHGFQGNQPAYYGNQYSNAYMNQGFNPPFGGLPHDAGPANKPYSGYQAPGGGFQNSYGNNNNQQQVGFAQTANQAVEVRGNPFIPRGPGGEPAKKAARISTVFDAVRNGSMQSVAGAEEDQKRRDRIKAMKKQIAYNDLLIESVREIKDAYESMTKNVNEGWERDTGATFKECKETFECIKSVLFKNQ
ncbi:hypothetical protein KC318_g412 [Hortaea werneckii]|nr:hypothetical protein KC334_g7800 [Hortaea werneckii]KAI7006953.1 hypothetical protein KC355_g7523 [Hortaea werneckii]KAI7202822.1 hypothetical protein KC324_g1551 [Hortaea werneckii]KAI7593590.1 hypothetical protein KC316_g1642 [Hortaea werneckii]KAI7676224.1 hypothetical protein KC318_g412 [Hortaea werneckii]